MKKQERKLKKEIDVKAANPAAKGEGNTSRSEGGKALKAAKGPKNSPKRTADRKREGDGVGVLRFVTTGGQFLRDARTELKKVKWPTRKELLATTAVVIFLVILVSFYLGLVDLGLIKIIKTIVG